MIIHLTPDQWHRVQEGGGSPVRVSDPSDSEAFVLLRADVYERLRGLFEEVPVSDQERKYQLQQFGRRAGWDDPEMDIYDDLDPRRQL